MKTNRLLGHTLSPLPGKVYYKVYVALTDGSAEVMAETPHGGSGTPSTLMIAAKRWADRLGYYVQLHHHRYGIVASAFPETEHA